MKITALRMKVALGYALGVLSALSISSYATDSEVSAELNKPAQGIHCPTYNNKVGEEFTCSHVDKDGEVVKTTTFLISMGSDGSLLPISADGAVETDKERSPTVTASDAVGGGAYGTVNEPATVLDEPDVDDDVGGTDVGGAEPNTQANVSITEEGVEVYDHWSSVFKSAYTISVDKLSTAYHDLFDSDTAPASGEGEVAEPQDIVIESEDLADPVVPEVEQVEEPVSDTPLAEAGQVEVKKYNWEVYAEYLESNTTQYSSLSTEVSWLAMNMVFEARDQGSIGLEAVADVTIKRLDIHLRGDKNIRDVVTDPAEFSWYDDDVLDLLTMNELSIYDEAVYMAETMLLDYMHGEWVSVLASDACPAGATHYHKTDITPDWQATMVADCGVIGDHHFWYGK